MTSFNPEVVIDNAVDNDQPLAGGCSAPRPNRLVDGVCPDGHLKKTNRYRLSLTCNGLDLRAFPFDTQILPIRLKARKGTLKPTEKDASDVILVGPEGLNGHDKKHGLRRMGHTVKMQAERLADFKIQSLMGLRSELPDRWYEVRIIVERSPGHAVRNVAVPCLVILTFSFTIYAIPMSELGSRLENTATCLLAMMAFQGVVNEMLPPVSYETALGRYVTAVYIILMFHGVEHALFSTLTSKSDSIAPRDRPIDIFFGTVEYWDANSCCRTGADPVHPRCVCALPFLAPPEGEGKASSGSSTCRCLTGGCAHGLRNSHNTDSYPNWYHLSCDSVPLDWLRPYNSQCWRHFASIITAIQEVTGLELAHLRSLGRRPKVNS